MPLHPQAEALRTRIAAAGEPPIYTLEPEDARRIRLARLRTGLPVEPVAKVEDRTIPGPAGPLPVRVYTPDGPGPHPVVVYYHGGGWVIGNLDTHDGSSRGICNASRCIIVSVDYRLAPEAKFPAAAEDSYAAAKWVVEHTVEIGGEAGRVAVAGESAGGNLAAAVCLMAKDRGGPPFAFQLLVYPVMEYGGDTPSSRENAEGYFLTKASMDWYWGHYLKAPKDGSHPYASPLKAKDLSGLPPALVITAEYDPLRDEGEAYASRLKEAGVGTICTRYGGMMHGFFNQPNDIDDARKAYAEAGAALRNALNP